MEACMDLLFRGSSPRPFALAVIRSILRPPKAGGPAIEPVVEPLEKG
jgi:hypothetical protein